MLLQWDKRRFELLAKEVGFFSISRIFKILDYGFVLCMLRIIGYSLVYLLLFLYIIFLPFCTLFVSVLCLFDVYI